MKHLKVLLFSAGVFLTGFFSYGQAKDASVMIEGENRSAVMINIQQSEKITREALLQRLERSGLKTRAKNGVARYKGVTLSEISPDKVDIYTKVQAGPNNSSVLYMAVSKGYDNFTNSLADTSITQNVKRFLDSFVADAGYYYADMDISNQLNAIDKEDKIYQDLLDEQLDLQKKKSTIDARLVAVEQELGVRKEMINKKRAAVNDARMKRSIIGNQ